MCSLYVLYINTFVYTYVYAYICAHMSISIKEYEQYRKKSGQLVPHVNVMCKSHKSDMKIYIGCKIDQASIPFN